jgi:xylulokinase
MKYLLAHDLGTSGNKATLFAETGQLIKSTTVSYPTDYFNNNWAEQDPQDWWKAVCSSTKKLLHESAINSSDVACVSFSGHMMGCLCLDKNGDPLRKHILWADQRATRQAAKLQEKIPLEKFYKITGHRNSAAYGLQKFMWIRDNEPELYEQTVSMVNAKDWLVFKLTGNILSEYSDATSTTALDLNKLEWSEEIISAAGIDPDKLPTLVQSTHIAGYVTPEAAALCGLKTGTPVVMGGGDGLCGTVGAGCVREEVVHACIGSSAWVSFAADKPLFDEEMRTFNWAHIVPGMICPCGTMQTAGSSYSWLKKQICQLESYLSELDGESAYQKMEAQIEQSKPGSNGVVFLPYLIGERAPHWNPDAKGAFLGLKMESTRADMIRSVLEGISMNLAIIIDVYRQYGYPVDSINLIGGGASSDAWCQIMADIWQSDVNRLNYLEEATSMGAAVAGGVGVGLYKDFNAIDRYVASARTFKPSSDSSNIYEPVRSVFMDSYKALLPLFDRF